MGVYINMEMPKSCADCPIGDSLHCLLMPGVPALWKEYTLALRTNRRHKDCPLVPVPPHGRLIDADAFAEKNKYFWNCEFINPKYSETLSDLVEAAPTVIPASEEGEG